MRGVQLSKERIVVVLQNSVRIYKFAKTPLLLSSYETANNPWGLCCMSSKKLAFPGRTTGHIQLVSLESGNVSIIPAHSSAVRAIQLSQDGELLATASETVRRVAPSTRIVLTAIQGTLVRIFATSSCARLAELRRGIDPATIFSLAFNPSGTMLACTSDKFTLHVFDVPNPKRPAPPPVSPRRADGGAGPSTDGGDGKGKWGILSKIPMMPRVFSDTYSFASVPFEAGEESLVGGLPMSENTTLGTSRPPKGVIGWLNDTTLLVVGAGKDARWEKFVIQQDGTDGKRVVVREGWKRYLGTP